MGNLIRHGSNLIRKGGRLIRRELPIEEGSEIDDNMTYVTFSNDLFNNSDALLIETITFIENN